MSFGQTITNIGQDVMLVPSLVWSLMGLFQSVEEINAAPFHAFGETKPGDIRYKDQNDDGVVDSNDQNSNRQKYSVGCFGLKCEYYI